MVTLTINGKTVCVPEGTSILDAARAANIDIPTLCYLKDLNEIDAVGHRVVQGGDLFEKRPRDRNRLSPRATTRCMRAWSSTRTLRRCA